VARRRRVKVIRTDISGKRTELKKVLLTLESLPDETGSIFFLCVGFCRDFLFKRRTL